MGDDLNIRVARLEEENRELGAKLALEIENHRVTAASTDKLEARIRELEEENAQLKAHWKDFMQWDESAVLYNWKERAEAAEAKLAKVVEFLEQCDKLCNCGSFDTDQMVTRAECSDCRRAALAAAKGE